MVNSIIKKIKKKKIALILPLLFILYSVSTACLTYSILRVNNIETFLRYMFCVFLILMLLYLLLVCINFILKGKDLAIILFSLILVGLFSVQSFGCTIINKVYTSIDKMNKDVITYSTSLVGLKENNVKSMSNVKDLKIGIIDNENSIDGYVIANDMINEKKLDKNNKIIKYEAYATMLDDLYAKKIDLMFVPSSYASMFSDLGSDSETSTNKYASIKDDTLVLETQTKQVKKVESTTPHEILETPFTILLMGVDSPLDNINSGTSLGDSLIIITFNPKTLNATILSIPRDTYVPIMCYKNHAESKITHSAAYGPSCVISTIENFTGINIDYYMKINFKGVVKLVDALGGVYVDVPYSFCEQNSDRLWGKNTIYVPKGYQNLNGEETLALARNRHPNLFCGPKWSNYMNNDFTRSQNQQMIITALINKLKDIKNLNDIYKILDIIQENVDTSLTTNDILSFYNVGKSMLLHSENGNVISFEKLYLDGNAQYIWDPSMGLDLWNWIYSKQSLQEDVTAMNINLGKEEPTLIKDFGFSINETYEQKTIGEGPFATTLFPVLENFVGKSQSYVESWGLRNGVKINVKTSEVNNSQYTDGEVIAQSLPKDYRIDYVNKQTGITITVAKMVNQQTSTSIDCSKKENANNKACLVPDFSTYTIDMANAWKENLPSSLMVTITEVPLDDPVLDADKAGKFISQDVNPNTNISQVSEIVIKYYEDGEKQE